MKIIKNLIAYQTVDPEGDIWSNRALVFESKDDVVEFFSNPLNVIEAIGYNLDEGDEIKEYTIHGNYMAITFLYYGTKVLIKEMFCGAFIKTE